MFGAIAGGIASALAGGAMSKLFGGGQKAASGGIQGDVLATDNNTVGMGDAGIKSAIQGSNVPNPDRSEERRVGKECRSRWSPCQLKKKKKQRRVDDGQWFEGVPGSQRRVGVVGCDEVGKPC